MSMEKVDEPYRRVSRGIYDEKENAFPWAGLEPVLDVSFDCVDFLRRYCICEEMSSGCR